MGRWKGCEMWMEQVQEPQEVAGDVVIVPESHGTEGLTHWRERERRQ